MHFSRAYLFAAAGALLTVGNVALAGHSEPAEPLFRNRFGAAQTLSAQGRIDPANPFFQPLGSNGRACVNCHEPAANFTITPSQIQAKFEATHGMDPLFRPNDGSDSPLADLATESTRRAACGMLLTKGLIRVGLPIPANAEFRLAEVDDPYGYASASELSLFRRPLPSTNLRFLSGVMWDGREGKPGPGTELRTLLENQAVNATLGHAQAAAPPTPEQVQAIVDFELGLTTAQFRDTSAGELHAARATGGPAALVVQPFYLGMNDVLGADPTGAPFAAAAMTLFQAWGQTRGADHARARAPRSDEPRRDDARAAVARGEALFNSAPIQITGVRGLNDDLGLTVVRGTCTTCHDSPNVGHHSVALPIDIGLTDAGRRTPDLPLYTLQNLVTGELRRTTDPGRALITGKWSDVGKFKGPILRGLGGRAPYFHNGSAATLQEVLAFYDTRFGIGFTPQEKADLVAFLSAL